MYGDILLSVNGTPVSSIDEFIKLRSAAGRELQLLVRRGTRVLEVTIHLRKATGLSPQMVMAELAEMGTERLAPGALHVLAATPEPLN